MTKEEVIQIMDNGPMEGTLDRGACKMALGFNNKELYTLHRICYLSGNTEPVLTRIKPSVSPMMNLDSIKFEDYKWVPADGNYDIPTEMKNFKI